MTAKTKKVWHGDPQLSRKTRPLDEIKPHPKNANLGDIGAVAESLVAHGQYQPIHVQTSTGYIIRGHTTYYAAESIGWTHIAAEDRDVDDIEALQRMMVDNETRDRAETDIEQHTQNLQFLAAEDRLYGSGFDGDDVDDWTARLEETEPIVNVRQTPSLDEYADGYRTRSVRSVLLDYVGKQYVWVTDRLAELRAEYGVGTNSEVVLQILEDRFPDNPIPDP